MTTTITATVSDDIRIYVDGVRDGVLDQLKSYLTIPNVAKHKALERGDFGANQMEDAFVLWSERVDASGQRLLLMPRGFAGVLSNGMLANGYEVFWADQTSTSPLPLVDRLSMEAPVLRPGQDDAVRAILEHRVGIVQADPGDGKTVIGLEAYRRLGQRGLVLVEKGHLVRQWRQRARDHLGVEAGVIGDGEWDERHLTIATIQTLYRRLPDLARTGWFKTWGATLADECHHAVAETYRQVFARACSSVLIGLTATPLDGDWLRKLLIALVGPVIYQVQSGATIKPDVAFVPTEWEWKPTKQEQALKDPRAIYRHLLAALVQDENRASVVAAKVVEQPEQAAQLVLAKQLGYLDMLRSLIVSIGYPEDRVLMYRGSEKLDEREAVGERAMRGSCVILSTIAGEGLDIPRLDRLHLPWPQRKELTLVQQFGRIARPWKGKLSPVGYDYFDTHPMLYEQVRARRRLYTKKEWRMIMTDPVNQPREGRAEG